MNLTDMYNECFTDEDLEKVAETEEAKENNYEEEVDSEAVENAEDNEIEKVAAGYVEAGREMARRDFAIIEQNAINELEKLGYVIEEEVDPKDEILTRMQEDPEYAQALIEKHVG